MKNVILLSIILFALSQTEVLVDIDQALFTEGLYIMMGAEVPFQKMVALHLALVPFTLAVSAIVAVLFTYLMECIEK